MTKKSRPKSRSRQRKQQQQQQQKKKKAASHDPNAPAGFHISIEPPQPSTPQANLQHGMPSRPKSPPAQESDKKAYCFEKGVRFKAPETKNTLSLLLRFWHPGSFVTLVTGFSMIWTGMPYYVGDALGMAGLPYLGMASNWHIFLVALFWRFMYNGFLGMILHQQSKTKFLTKWIATIQDAPSERFSATRHFINWLLRGTAGCNEPLSVFPAGFNAWMLNMQWVNVILPLDVLAFVLVVARSFEVDDCVFQSSTLISAQTIEILCTSTDILSYVGGVLLFGFSVVGKHSAFKVIGHYAWFWGDFFYGLDLKLKFDGIFDVVPHPMYTVGYGWMYGCALITRSSDVTVLALGSHLLQIGFLVFVEDPHIQKLYGPETVSVPFSEKLLGVEERRSRSQSEDEGHYVDSNILLVKNFDFFRASDWQLVIICILMISGFAICSMPLEPQGGYVISTEVLFGVVIFGRALGTAARAVLLLTQARSRFWTNHFVSQGQSLGKAFTEYKRLQNTLDTCMNLSSVLLCLRYFYDNLAFGHYMKFSHEKGPFYIPAVLLSSAAMVLLSLWALNSSYKALGDQGWFYGDFFLSEKDGKKKELVYEGIYRYINNPDVILGKLWMYGLALLTLQWQVFLLALLAHGFEWLFLIAVEEPYMKRFYEAKRIRKHSSALTKKLKTEILPRIAAATRAQYYRAHTGWDNFKMN